VLYHNHEQHGEHGTQPTSSGAQRNSSSTMANLAIVLTFALFFFLEYAGELRIIVLRRE